MFVLKWLNRAIYHVEVDTSSEARQLRMNDGKITPIMKSSRHSSQPYMSFWKRTALCVSVCVITLSISAAIYSKTAHASLFSLIVSLIQGQKASAQTQLTASSSNIQTLALLQAPSNKDPNPEKFIEPLPVETAGVLVADSVMSEDAVADSAVNTQVSTYIVQSGDTISSVAKMFGVTTNTVLWANNLTGKSVLKAGSTLVILPISGITYTVKKGDTVQGILKKYKADAGDVLAYNDISLNSPLSIGQTLIIPNAEIQISVPTKIVYGSTNPAHDTNNPAYPGYYIRPITGGRKSQGLHGYNGVDLADRTGTAIHAAAAGTVIVSKVGGWNGGYGNMIIISHTNGTQTVYAHNSKNLVTVGEYVDQGQTIALMGSTGHSTGPHVHFEIRGAKNPF